MKLISFAVPCYNSAEYMDKCINSLLKAGEDAEIIIVNDGSTKDNTQEIAEKYAKDYPTIVKAVNKENGGHGDAVTVGLRNSTGKYFKVVDSDDWVDEDALNKVMDFLRSLDEDNSPDVLIVNYVIERVFENKQKRVNYKKEFPVNRMFSFEESKKFTPGKYITMHALIHKRQILEDMNFEMPKHTFYVDNILICKPMFNVKTFYYLDVDFYRYFIGRADQSVNEKVLMSRIDQHIRMTKILLYDCDYSAIKETRPRLYDYLINHVCSLMVVNSIYLIKIDTPESMQTKKEIWEELKEKDPETYKQFKSKFISITSSNNKFVCDMCKVIYVFVKKILKFN